MFQIQHFAEALTRKEFYLLWFTRLCVVMLSNVVSAYYKALGQTFIRDDQFLSMVGAITSVFNCSGRVLYGLVMDRWAYKVSMSLEAVLLILLMSTFYLTSLIGVPGDMEPVCAELVSNLTSATTATSTSLPCVPEELPTSLTTKLVYAAWVWAIYLTFPGGNNNPLPAKQIIFALLKIFFATNICTIKQLQAPTPPSREKRGGNKFRIRSC